MSTNMNKIKKLHCTYFDNNFEGEISKLNLRDATGKPVHFSASQLKQDILDGKIEVDNLTIDDDKLVRVYQPISEDEQVVSELIMRLLDDKKESLKREIRYCLRYEGLIIGIDVSQFFETNFEYQDNKPFSIFDVVCKKNIANCTHNMYFNLTCAINSIINEVIDELRDGGEIICAVGQTDENGCMEAYYLICDTSDVLALAIGTWGWDRAFVERFKPEDKVYLPETCI